MHRALSESHHHGGTETGAMQAACVHGALSESHCIMVVLGRRYPLAQGDGTVP